MRRAVIVSSAAIFMFGCASPTRPQLQSFDGKPIDKVALEQATFECEAKAKVATANMPHGQGLGGAIARDIERKDIEKASLQGCLAEKGIKLTWQQEGQKSY